MSEGGELLRVKDLVRGQRRSRITATSPGSWWQETGYFKKSWTLVGEGIRLLHLSFLASFLLLTPPFLLFLSFLPYPLLYSISVSGVRVLLVLGGGCGLGSANFQKVWEIVINCWGKEIVLWTYLVSFTK